MNDHGEVEALRSLVSLPVDHPVACFKQKEQTKLMFIFFSNGNGSAFENNFDCGPLSQASLRNVQRQRCWKRYSGDGQRLWDYGTTERFFNAVSALCVAVERRGSTLT